MAIRAGVYSTGSGDRMNLDLAVAALLTAGRPSARDAVTHRGDEAGLVAAPVRLG